MQVQTEISDLGMQFFFFFFFGREVWQGLLKTEVTFQESFKRWKNGEEGGGERQQGQAQLQN